MAYEFYNGLSCRNEKVVPQIHMDFQGAWVAKTILKNNYVGEFLLPHSKTYYKAIIIKIVCFWHKDRHIDQWNRFESPETNPYIYGQLIFNKGDKSIQWRKNCCLFNSWCWDNWISICKRMRLDPNLTPQTKFNSKGIKDLNIRAKAIRPLEENIKVKLHNLGFSTKFLNIIPKTLARKEVKLCVCVCACVHAHISRTRGVQTTKIITF